MYRAIGWLATLSWLCVGTALAQERETHPFDRDWLLERARELAQHEFVARELDARSPLNRLEYDQYRAIEFQRGAAIWKGEGRNFTVQLLHPGFIFKTPVDINLVVGGVSRRVLYTNQIFNYGLESAERGRVPAPGYSGFRVAYPINSEDVQDEFLVFQGASYFRAVGRGDRYGLSARGLAVGTATREGEEFPAFTKFWIERPGPDAQQIVIHALLDSRSVTGAYTFTADPGAPTVVDVEAVLFPRRDLARYGIAPLTSMFLFDATNSGRFDDFRAAVHDSDGLAIELANGERVWRPLANPRALQVSSFVVDTPRRFGLMQRRREFRDYEDIEARYELRPAAWIEPRADWGKGYVELVEIPTDKEIHDNIVAFWQPSAPLEAGGQYSFAYRINWGEGPATEGRARIAATRAGGEVDTDLRHFAIDYEAERIPEDLEVSVTTSAGAVIDARGAEVEGTGRYRVNVHFDPQGEDLAELRLVVSHADKPWAETWLYRWTR
jgi:periplasmic glucans biosynthesis protein